MLSYALFAKLCIEAYSSRVSGGITKIGLNDYIRYYHPIKNAQYITGR